MNKGPKITCSAFGCKRWTRRGTRSESVVLCADHWPMVPKRLRTLFNKSQRRLWKQGIMTDKEVTRSHRLWRKCVAAANRNIGM